MRAFKEALLANLAGQVFHMHKSKARRSVPVHRQALKTVIVCLIFLEHFTEPILRCQGSVDCFGLLVVRLNSFGEVR